MTTSRRWFRPAVAVTLGLAFGAVWYPVDRVAMAADIPPARAETAAEDRPAPAEREPYDPRRVQETVEFWEKRASDDPRGALARRELAGAYLARQREAGAIEDAVRAEQAARQSLEILPRGNAVALNRLARSLLAQHRFPEALDTARLAAAIDPQAYRLIADLSLELGDYDEAERAAAKIPAQPDDLNLKMLRARILAIQGKPDRALEMMQEASRLADGLYDLPHETVAWHHVMVGHALIDCGKLEEGERACRKALEVFPRDYRAMTGLAEVAAWRGDWRGAVAWGKKAVAVAPQNPEALKVIGDASAALGQAEEAERHYRLLKELAHSFPRIYDRHWAMFCADAGRDLDEALALARKDLELRRDVHAYDTLAWVSFKKGLMPEAEAATRKALARGTREATLLYHAGMIARAGGDTARAKDCFTRARAINPRAIPLRWLRWMDAEDETPP